MTMGSAAGCSIGKKFDRFVKYMRFNTMCLWKNAMKINQSSVTRMKLPNICRAITDFSGIFNCKIKRFLKVFFPHPTYRISINFLCLFSPLINIKINVSGSVMDRIMTRSIFMWVWQAIVN